MRVNLDPAAQSIIAKVTAENVKNLLTSVTNPLNNQDQANKAEQISQAFANLEKGLFELFLAQGPQLGQTVARLQALQQQNMTSFSPDNLDDQIKQNTDKLLDALKSLVISPKDNADPKGTSVARIQQSLFILLDELAQVKQQAPLVLQTKIDAFLQKLSEVLPELRELVKTELTPQLANASTKQTPQTFQESEAAAATNLPNNTDAIVSEEALLVTQHKHALHAQETPQEAYKEIPIETDLPAEVLKKIPEQIEQENLDITEPPDIKSSALTPKQLPPSTVTVYAKIQTLLENFKNELTALKVEPEVMQLLDKLAANLKDLQVNPDTQWDRLLKYPVIYKQVLQKTAKALQEFLSLKQVENQAIRQSLTDLWGEITANLHVQVTANQSAKENPAHQQIYYQIPLQLGTELKNGEMLVTHEREHRGDHWEKVCSWYQFYLETQYIGPVNVSIQALQKQLTIKFVVADAEQAQSFAQDLDTLKKILYNHGYEVLDISCTAGEVYPLYPLLKDNIAKQGVDISV